MGLMKLTQKNTTNIDPVMESKIVLQKIKSELNVLQCYIFGSSVSQNFHSDSDLDLLLIFSDSADLKSVQKIIYSKRWSALPIDFILKNKSDFDARKLIGGVCFEAFHNGIEIT